MISQHPVNPSPTAHVYMNRLSFILIAGLLLYLPRVEGQVINNLSPDKTNMYVHAVDSAAAIVLKPGKFRILEIVAENSITSQFPDTLSGLEIRKMTHGEAEKKKIAPNAARFIVHTVQIIKDQFKIRILTWSHDGRLGDGQYIFRYKYIPESMTYELKEIKRGMVL